jgi:hypothetical protein
VTTECNECAAVAEGASRWRQEVERTVTTFKRSAEAAVRQSLIERGEMLDNLTATQARCTELLLANRALRRRSDPAYRSPHALDALVAQLGADEVRVLTRIAERLVMGRKQYGELDIASDGRDWNEEARQEVLDLAVYAAIKLEGGR